MAKMRDLYKGGVGLGEGWGLVLGGDPPKRLFILWEETTLNLRGKGVTSLSFY